VYTLERIRIYLPRELKSKGNLIVLNSYVVGTYCKNGGCKQYDLSQVVSVLQQLACLLLEFLGFKPTRSDEFLRAIKIRRTPSFGGEVKQEVPSRKIIRHVKESLASINRNTARPNSNSFCPFLLLATR
jgi:hypothetical protein